MTTNLKNRNLEKEFRFSSSRSSGPGGQNVNKVNSKIELRFSITKSLLLSDLEKFKIRQKLKNRINIDDELVITSQIERSQLKNKKYTVDRFFQLLEQALKPVKKRKATRPSKSSVEKRLKRKKMAGEKKANRKKID